MTRRQVLLGALTAANLPARAQQPPKQDSPQDPAALKLARIVHAIDFGKLSPAGVKHAKMILASTLASASAGRNLDSVRIVRDLAESDAGKPAASLWFDTPRLPVTAAARANAMASDAAASDDSDLRNVAHIGTSVTAVGLAVGEAAGSSGRDLLSAIAAGYEAAGRIGEAIALSSTVAGNSGAINGSIGPGFHASAVVAFGGTVAAAKLLRLTPEQIAQALGITATTVGGLAISSNSDARQYQAGNAALTAVNAALAAGRGYTVNPDMLEATGGFLSIFAGGKADIASLERQAAADDQISRYLAVKLIPGAHALHCAVEAAINAAKAMPASAGNVERILVAGPQSELAASRRAPKNVAEAIHSLPFYLASAVADRDFTWASADPKRIEQPAVARLMALVDKDPAPNAIRYEWSWSATVTLVSASGERYSSTVQAPRGSAPRGIEWTDIDAKYRALTPQSGLPPARLEQILKQIHDFENLKDVAGFARLLRMP